MDHFERREPKELKASDLSLDKSFIGWVRNNDPQSEQFWTEWLMNNPEVAEKVEMARSIVLAMQFREEGIPSHEVEAAWTMLYEQLSVQSLKKNGRRLPGIPWNGFIKIAASVVFIISLTVIAYLLIRQFGNAKTEFITKAAAPGQKLSITLPDGTSVKLNSESELQYPAEFAGTFRDVVLHGEAFFNVAHNDQMPFKVKTNGVSVIVLGTSFNVDAYPRSADVRVALAQGKIKINLEAGPDRNRDIFLSPDEMIRIDKGSYDYEIQPFKSQEVTAWKDGWLYLKKADFNETVMELERWFGVKFEIAPGFQVDPGWRFTGKFQHKSLSYILTALSYPDLFKYKIERQKVIIY